MSNCVTVKNPDIRFNRDEFDIDHYKKLLAEAEARINEKNCVSWSDDIFHNIMINTWWFLSRNSKVCDDHVDIILGHGRSGHTTRDLRGTLNILREFLIKDKTIVLFVRDVDMPCNYLEEMKHVMNPPKVTHDILWNILLTGLKKVKPDIEKELKPEFGTNEKGLLYCKIKHSNSNLLHDAIPHLRTQYRKVDFPLNYRYEYIEDKQYGLSVFEESNRYGLIEYLDKL